MEEANPLMIVLARESRGLSQSALAARLSIRQGTLSKIEHGRLPAPEGLTASLSAILQYPESFFRESHGQQSLPVSFYRKRVRVSATHVRSIQARINILRLHAHKLLASVDMPELRIPAPDPDELRGRVEQVARELRIFWNVPAGPLQNLTRLIEDAGILVVACNFDTNQVDAVSLYTKQDHLPPMIFVNHRLPGDRLRFSLAHELGHIILHQHLLPPECDIESEANRFAAELLMPAADIRPHLRVRNLRDFASLKPYWKVSISSLVRRAAELGRITAHQKRHLMAKISQYGYRLEEPHPIEAEEPTLIKELVSCHLNDLEYTDEDMGELLGLEVGEFQSQYGGNSGRPYLRVVRGG